MKEESLASRYGSCQKLSFHNLIIKSYVEVTLGEENLSLNKYYKQLNVMLLPSVT